MRVGGEKCSYQIPTYEALKGVMASVYWQPTLVWYIDSVRVSEAEKLMITKDLSINEVAYKVGFFDQGSFYRLYKRVRGFTPTDFKKKLKY